jgi:hypothetical protein
MIRLKFREQLFRDLVVSYEENTEMRGVPRCRSSSSEILGGGGAEENNEKSLPEIADVSAYIRT